jgi:hypothetical protein
MCSIEKRASIAGNIRQGCSYSAELLMLKADQFNELLRGFNPLNRDPIDHLCRDPHLSRSSTLSPLWWPLARSPRQRHQVTATVLTQLAQRSQEHFTQRWQR